MSHRWNGNNKSRRHRSNGAFLFSFRSVRFLTLSQYTQGNRHEGHRATADLIYYLALRVGEAPSEDGRADERAQLPDARRRRVPGQLAAGNPGKRVEHGLEEHVKVALELLLADSLGHGRQLHRTMRRKGQEWGGGNSVGDEIRTDMVSSSVPSPNKRAITTTWVALVNSPTALTITHAANGDAAALGPSELEDINGEKSTA